MNTWLQNVYGMSDGVYFCDITALVHIAALTLQCFLSDVTAFQLTLSICTEQTHYGCCNLIAYRWCDLRRNECCKAVVTTVEAQES